MNLQFDSSLREYRFDALQDPEAALATALRIDDDSQALNANKLSRISSTVIRSWSKHLLTFQPKKTTKALHSRDTLRQLQTFALVDEAAAV